MKPALLACLAAVTMIPAACTTAGYGYGNDNWTVQRAEAQYQRDLRAARNDYERRQARQDYERNLDNARYGRSNDNRDWRGYDYNRPEAGQGGYYADRYYRTGNRYAQQRVGLNDRIYRGRDDDYYCRRSDGSTGRLSGVDISRYLDRRLRAGNSELLRNLLTGRDAYEIRREVDRGRLVCR